MFLACRLLVRGPSPQKYLFEQEVVPMRMALGVSSFEAAAHPKEHTVLIW